MLLETNPALLIERSVNRMLLAVVNEDPELFARVAEIVSVELNCGHWDTYVHDILSRIDFGMLNIPIDESPVDTAVELRSAALGAVAALGLFEAQP